MVQTVLQILKNSISDPSVFFVFPTQVAADSWADELLASLGTGTVAMERFTAWDTFKGNSIRSQQQDRTSVPSVLRKLYAARLITQNAALVAAGKEPLFRSLINPVYAQDADSFSDWFASLLPQLALWKKHLRAAPCDAEDIDLERLYELYRDFLDANSMFDPAWETPPFDSRGNSYIIFYPEILEDFAEYQELLSESPNITLVKADELVPLMNADDGSGYADTGDAAAAGNTQNFIHTFDNSRAELHALALEILRSHNEDGIPYEDMAVSIDKEGLLLPYLTRELEMYSIPVKQRLARPLTSHGAGLLFPQIQECVSTHFSFEAVKNLMLNNELPWKEKQLNAELINFGIKNSCICSYEKNGEVFDVWADAFRAIQTEERLSTFYSKLKLRLENMARAESFKDIEDSYFAFRSAFFNEDEFTEEADNILGRCLKELSELIRIQKEYSGMSINGCFSFFTRQLASTEYLAQSGTTGILLYPYRNAAAAPKARHFVPAAGQDAVTVTYSPLRFLSQEKREQLGVEDTDVSALFLKIYGQNSKHGVWYSCAEKSFSGYTLPHSALPAEEAAVPESGDPVAEQHAWLSGQRPAFPAIVSETDKAGFAQWASFAGELSSPDNALGGIDKSKLYEGDKIRVSQSALKAFFTCPRSWFYGNCLKLKPFSLEAGLMEDVFIGTLYHKILEHFFTSIQNDSRNQILSMDNASVYADYTSRIDRAVDFGFANVSGSPLTKKLLDKQKAAWTDKVTSCLVEFCTRFAGCSVAGMEREITMPVDGKDYIYTGTIDLILRNIDDQVILIDFKTGSSPSKAKCFPDEENVLKDFQFAMYTKLWEYQNPTPDDKVFECHFFEITKCHKNTIVGKTQKNAKYRQDMEFSISLLEQYSEAYADAIRSGPFKADITPSFSDCAACNYKAICRSTYTVSGDTSLTAAKEEQDNE